MGGVANLDGMCAKKLNESGVVNISTTCDGPTVDSDKILGTQVGLGQIIQPMQLKMFATWKNNSKCLEMYFEKD